MTCRYFFSGPAPEKSVIVFERGFKKTPVCARAPLRLQSQCAHGFVSPVVLPHKIATLLYCFNERDEVLLMERLREPNKGLWSPCGGKLVTETGESPYACACREAHEEIGWKLEPADLHLTGIVSEHGYQGQAHWLMFLFEVKPRLPAAALPAAHAEGRFEFFARDALDALRLPETDRQQIWPLFWRHRGGFFAAHCRATENCRNEWLLEESIPQHRANA